MSTVHNESPWPNISKENLHSKYEKCRNITEEIYKRINITFQIKQLEETVQSDLSDNSSQIDSNDLSNETDLFACDKSDSIPSSTEEKPASTCEKYININNNEETKKKAATVYKRPKKRFRKRVKKRQWKAHSDSDGSSDEALPLSRVVELEAPSRAASRSPDRVMGVPKILILTKDLKPKILSSDKKQPKKTEPVSPPKAVEDQKIVIKTEQLGEEKKGDTCATKEEKCVDEKKTCTMCNVSFRGERGLKRHLALSHITVPDDCLSADTKPA